jgi:hypothetical protein
MPARGQVAVEVSQTGVTLIANHVTQLRALQELASALGFTPLVEDEVTSGERRTFEAFDLSPEALVALVLRGVPYALVYEVDVDGNHVLREVVVGKRAAPTQDERQTVANRAREPRAAPSQWLSPEELEQLRARRERLIAEREADRLARRDEILRDLDSWDPRTRAEAVEEFLPDGPEEVERLGQIALNDPEPSVRTAAVEQLGDSQTAASVRTLLRALDDSEGAVAVAALESLEWVGDESVIPQIRPLLSDSDPEVRVAAAAAIEWLE